MSDASRTKAQFRVLRREFLFRMADLEAFSPIALGDANKLLGQFAALLDLYQRGESLLARSRQGRIEPPSALLELTLYTEHILITMTMVVVGIFAVLTLGFPFFQSRQDVLVLAPLPVRPRATFSCQSRGDSHRARVSLCFCCTGRRA